MHQSGDAWTRDSIETGPAHIKALPEPCARGLSGRQLEWLFEVDFLHLGLISKMCDIDAPALLPHQRVACENCGPDVITCNGAMDVV